MATSGRGSGVVGYNVQVAVETENHLIVTHEVTTSGSATADSWRASEKAAKAQQPSDALRSIGTNGRCWSITLSNGARRKGVFCRRSAQRIPPSASGSSMLCCTFWFLATSGLRVGEASKPRWANIQLVNGSNGARFLCIERFPGCYQDRCAYFVSYGRGSAIPCSNGSVKATSHNLKTLFGLVKSERTVPPNNP